MTFCRPFMNCACWPKHNTTQHYTGRVNRMLPLHAGHHSLQPELQSRAETLKCSPCPKHDLNLTKSTAKSSARPIFPTTNCSAQKCSFANVHSRFIHCTAAGEFHVWRSWFPVPKARNSQTDTGGLLKSGRAISSRTTSITRCWEGIENAQQLESMHMMMDFLSALEIRPCLWAGDENPWQGTFKRF